MAKIHQIKVERRQGDGRGASRRLRKAGKVPAIVYGGELAPVSIEIVHNDAWLAAQHEWFYSSILDLSLNGDVQKVLLRDMQRHPFKQQLLHLDFQRVDENKPVHLRVPLHFLGQEKSPAGKKAGVLISHAMIDVEVFCLPKDLPEFIEVDLSDLNVDQTVHLSDLKLPANVEIAALRLGKEHDTAVVTAQEVRVIEEAPAAAPAADAAAAGATPAAATPAAGAAPAKAAPAKK